MKLISASLINLRISMQPGVALNDLACLNLEMTHGEPAMRTKTAIDHFGGKPSELAKALGISPSAVSQWGDVVPELRQLQLEKITNGALTAESKTQSEAA
jgi:hypothetical protein